MLNLEEFVWVKKTALPAPTETDYRGWLAMLLIAITAVVCVYAMHLGWPVTDVLALLGFFGLMDSSAVTYYFVSKQASNGR